MVRTSMPVAVVLAALVLCSLPAAAQTAADPPDLARAKELAETLCVACHGAGGNSAIPAYPKLAGQGADYISQQLRHFKDGVRTEPTMQSMAAPLTPAEITALGVYFSQQKPGDAAARDPQSQPIALAQTLYRAGDAATDLPACAACHAPTGAGLPRNFPRLAGQPADYTYAQLKAFKAGERGNDKDGKDVQGRIMADIAARMSDAQMKALADYVAGLL